MKIGLLIIGSEILDGKISDLNGRFLTDFLKEYHLELHTTQIVRDHEEEILRGLKSLFEICNLVITSGGIGPTKDDLTKACIGKFFNRPLLFSQQSFDVADENYRRLNRPYPGKDHPYSFLPQGFESLSNSSGFAPAFYVAENEHFLFSAPGVPREFKSIMQDHLSTWLKKHITKNEFLTNVIIRTRRLPEEKIFSEVDPQLWEKLETLGEVSSLPIISGVNIGVKIRAQDEAELEAKKEAIFKIIEHSPLRPNVWHFGPEKLEEVIVKKATELKINFGFAESCTGGLCSHRITNVSGSSIPFKGSVICYDTQVKINQLKVPKKTINEFGVVSNETATAMAEGLAKTLNLDFAVATTGIAGPGGGTEENPVGTICIGYYFRGKVDSVRYCFSGNRELLKERFSEAALMGLLEHMEKFAEN